MIETKIKPSRWYYLLAGGILVMGLIGFSWLLLTNLSSLTKGMTQVIVPGEQKVTLEKPGDYTVFHEYNSMVGNKVYSNTPGEITGLLCALRSQKTGEEILLSPATMNAKYSLGSRSGVSIFEFQIDSPGTYVFSAQYPPNRAAKEAVLSIAQGFGGKFFPLIFGGLGIMFVTLGASISIVVITFIKRKRAS